MATQAKRIRLQATTGIAPSAYGKNVYLRVEVPEATRSLASERLLAAATFRAAAAIEERMLEQSSCAVSVDEHEGRIHLEFATSATPAEEQAARVVLDAVAGEINRKGRA